MTELSPSSSLRFLVAAALAGGFLALSGTAHARATFPGIVDTKYPDVNCPPPCTMCHTSPAGGFDTLDQPFVVSLESFGIQVTKDSLPTLLDGMRDRPCPNKADLGCAPDMTGACTGKCDANGDGKTDIEQLSAGINPNTGEALFCVTYGCGGAHIAPKPEGRSLDGTLALGMFGALVVLSRRLRLPRARFRRG